MTPGQMHTLLERLHHELSRAVQLDAASRVLLEQVAADIRAALAHDVEAADLPPSLHVQHGAALEDAAVRFEATHPALAHAARTLLDALARVGL